MILWLRAKDNNIPIGSGKISRRVRPYRRKKRKAFTPPSRTSSIFKSNKAFAGGTSDKVKSRLEFPSSACKRIFLHWQRLGFPFTRHKEGKSKTMMRAIALIEKNRKMDGDAQVINSIDRCRKLFSSDWFKYRIYFDQRKLSLPNFFYFPSTFYKTVIRRIPDCPRSWYEECSNKSFGDLMEKYAVGTGDDRNLTNQLAKIWEEYIMEKCHRRDLLSLTSVARKIRKIAKLNNKNEVLTGNISSGDVEQYIITVFEEMLINYKTYKPKDIGWLLSDNFLNKAIPNEVVRQNFLTKEELNWKRL